MEELSVNVRRATRADTVANAAGLHVEGPGTPPTVVDQLGLTPELLAQGFQQALKNREQQIYQQKQSLQGILPKDAADQIIVDPSTGVMKTSISSTLDHQKLAVQDGMRWYEMRERSRRILSESTMMDSRRYKYGF